MLKNASYKDKFIMLRDWMPNIVETIKKDLRVDHLKADREFHKKYFAGKVPNKITQDELVEAYYNEIVEESNEGLGEYLCNRWLLKNTEIYDEFAKHLEKISTEFDAIEVIEDKDAKPLLLEAGKQFGILRTLLFAVFNSVVFTEATYKDLQLKAKDYDINDKIKQVEAEESLTLEKLKKKNEQHISRLTNKYEKKLVGLQRKYLTDTDRLKKQLSDLQRKMQAVV